MMRRARDPYRDREAADEHEFSSQCLEVALKRLEYIKQPQDRSRLWSADDDFRDVIAKQRQPAAD